MNDERSNEVATRLLNDGRSYEVQLSELGAAKVQLLLADMKERGRAIAGNAPAGWPSNLPWPPNASKVEHVDENAVLNAALSRGLNSMIRDSLGGAAPFPWPYHLPGAHDVGVVQAIKAGE